MNTRTPSGDDVTQRIDSKSAFSQDLFEQVLQRNNLQAAWKRVRANKGAAGVDGMTIDEFPAWAKSGHWKTVTTNLETGLYRPSPVRRVEIDKPDGGKRQLGFFITRSNRYRPGDSASHFPGTHAHLRPRFFGQQLRI
ncbi:MAG: RNA-directed DNA polymerase [Motiliproteus sp.]